MITNTIRWEVFTSEERRDLKTAIGKEDYKIFTNLIHEMTPDKEAELSKLVDLFKAQQEGYSSQVRNDMEKEFHSKQTQDLSPAEEAEWQQKLDKEKEEMSKKSQNKDNIKNISKNKVLNELEKIDNTDDKNLNKKPAKTQDITKEEEEERKAKQASDEKLAKEQADAMDKLEAEEMAEAEKAENDAKEKKEADKKAAEAKKEADKKVAETKKVTETKKTNK